MNATTEVKATWRLIHTPPASGAWNMAVDEALLESGASGRSRPALRLYAWQPACLSLGLTQPAADVDLERLHAHGWDLVRRPTGGRAILHVDELTYSVSGPQAEACLAGTVLESYRRLAQALLSALHRLQIPAQALEKPLQGPPAGPGKGPVCFEVPSNYEITVAGQKLLGSAQARRKEGVLQHGALPLFGDLRRITRVLAFADEAARLAAAQRLVQRATTCEQVLGRPLAWEAAAAAFATAFAEVLAVELRPDDLTAWEQQRAAELAADKYAAAAWTFRL